MNIVLKVFLSMSFSGSLLMLVLFLGKRFWEDKISRQWQYYIWLVVVLRLLIPFGPETNLMGKTYEAADRMITQAVSAPSQQSILHGPEDVPIPAVRLEQNNENVMAPTEDLTTVHPLQDIRSLLINHVWLIWLVLALGLLIRKITIYQSFIHYIRAGRTLVSDMEILDGVSVTAKQAGIQRPIELCVHPLVSSPLLIGFFHPCIVLPSTDLPEKDFPYIILHELTHYRRRDLLYKWLVQVTVCLHWFNPLVYFMNREIIKACEFSCDEAVLAKTGGGNAQAYGKTLLNAMAAVGKYKENFGAVTLSENKQLLKERLNAIMKFKKSSRFVKILTIMLTLCMIFGASFLGTYTMGNAYAVPDSISPDTTGRPLLSLDISSAAAAADLETEQYYETGSLPLFEIAFAQLDEEAQEKWLDKIYADGQTAFWGVATGVLDEDCAFIQRYAQKVYEEDNIAYFSILATHMSEDTLEKWLDRAQKDEKWNFQSVLFSGLGREDEFDKLEEKQEKEWEKEQAAEYQAAGVTMDGKNYYYQGQLVRLFLDIRSNKSFYTLDMNPKGTINIKMIRSEENEITGVAYMTEAEVTELLGDME